MIDNSMPQLAWMLGAASAFLVLYSLSVTRLFSRKVNGRTRRRRWALLDFVWVPVGGLTGLVMLALLLYKI